MSGAADPIVVVGASLAGVRAAEALRAAGYDGELTIVGDEPCMPYTRPPLSKEVLAGAREPADGALDCTALAATWRLGTRAEHLDAARRRIALADGSELGFRTAIVATGCRARPWRGPGARLAGLYTLRDADDALALRAALADRPRLAVVGAGVLGCEVAATARGRGLDVTMIDVAPQPMGALGPVLGAHVAERHRAHGVALRLGAGIAGFEGAGRVERVRLVDGSAIEADVAVVALGALPNAEWLEGSGLDLRDGVVCDATLTALGAPHVLVAGDVACQPVALLDGAPRRSEHWTNAAQQGALAGRNALLEPGAREPFEQAPSFWSDQYGVKIQAVGLPAFAERMTVVLRDEDGGPRLALGERDGCLVAAVGFDAARHLPAQRARLGQPVGEPAPA